MPLPLKRQAAWEDRKIVSTLALAFRMQVAGLTQRVAAVMVIVDTCLAPTAHSLEGAVLVLQSLKHYKEKRITKSAQQS